MPRVAACSDVRQAVLNAAQTLMCRYGYKKMTVDDIATEVGIGKATLYGYFANKQEVGLAVIDHYHQSIQDGWREIDEKDLTVTDKLRAMIMHRVMFLFDVATAHYQSLDDCLASLRPLVLQRGMERGEFALQDPVNLARTILTCSGGLMPLNLSSRELASRDQVIEKTDQVTNLILRGIKADGRPTDAELAFASGGDPHE